MGGLGSRGYERVHSEAVERVRRLKTEDLDRSIPFFTGESLSLRDVLWGGILLHGFHHRGRLVGMCGKAGGTPTGLYGPTYEEMAALRPGQ